MFAAYGGGHDNGLTPVILGGRVSGRHCRSLRLQVYILPPSPADIVRGLLGAQDAKLDKV